MFEGYRQLDIVLLEVLLGFGRINREDYCIIRVICAGKSLLEALNFFGNFILWFLYLAFTRCNVRCNGSQFFSEKAEVHHLINTHLKSAGNWYVEQSTSLSLTNCMTESSRSLVYAQLHRLIWLLEIKGLFLVLDMSRCLEWKDWDWVIQANQWSTESMRSWGCKLKIDLQ